LEQRLVEAVADSSTNWTAQVACPARQAIHRSSFARVLVVDDDAIVVQVARGALEAAGYDIFTACSAEVGLEIMGRFGVPDLAILDVRLPRTSGLELGRRLRKTSDLPIVMLSSVDDQTTVVEAIREFADDYVKKPFDPDELTARVARILSRRAAVAEPTEDLLELPGVVLDIARRRVLRDGEWTPLTPTEGKILEVLLRNAGHTVTSQALLEHVWPDGEVFEDALRVNVHRLRRKIEVDPARASHLITERGLGYRFCREGGVR
jgi:DNA-binding response OmpR family regulator